LAGDEFVDYYGDIALLVIVDVIDICGIQLNVFGGVVVIGGVIIVVVVVTFYSLLLLLVFICIVMLIR